MKLPNKNQEKKPLSTSHFLTFICDIRKDDFIKWGSSSEEAFNIS